MYEQPPARHRVGPALIAMLVLLATVAGAGSYFVVRQVLIYRAAQAEANASAGSPSASGSRSPAQSAAPVPTGPQTIPTVTTKADDPGTSCPAITAKAVADFGLNGELKLLRYVEASLTGGSGAEAWVCRNADGVLFYQGHRKAGRFDTATSTDTLLLGRGILGKVDTEGDDGFVAINPEDAANPDDPNHTEYHVSPRVFYYITPQGARTEYAIVRIAG